ncbi:hypothetical protein Tco_0493788 [Tanacetum coccineum]
MRCSNLHRRAAVRLAIHVLSSLNIRKHECLRCDHNEINVCVSVLCVYITLKIEREADSMFSWLGEGDCLLMVRELLASREDIITEFCGPSLWKELSKESGSKILPCGDGSCWKTFKPIAGPNCWHNRKENEITLRDSFPIFTCQGFK